MRPHPLIRILELTGVAVLLAIATVYFSPAFAQDATVTVPVGSWLDSALPVLGSILTVLVGAVLLIVVRFLPPWMQALVTPAMLRQVQVLAADAIEYGVQATSGAVKNTVITIPVGNSVVALAAQHALDNWPAALVKKLGGAEGVKLAVIKQLENAGVILPAESTASQILSSAHVASVRNPQ